MNRALRGGRVHIPNTGRYDPLALLHVSAAIEAIYLTTMEIEDRPPTKRMRALTAVTLRVLLLEECDKAAVDVAGTFARPALERLTDLVGLASWFTGVPLPAFMEKLP
jgi:hypothetical protein